MLAEQQLLEKEREATRTRLSLRTWSNCLTRARNDNHDSVELIYPEALSCPENKVLRTQHTAMRSSYWKKSAPLTTKPRTRLSLRTWSNCLTRARNDNDDSVELIF